MDNDEKWAAQTVQLMTLIGAYEKAALEAAAEYQKAKVRFAEAKAKAIREHMDNHGNVTRADAEFSAGSNLYVKQAVGDAAFYSNEARMYAQLVIMLRGPRGEFPITT